MALIRNFGYLKVLNEVATKLHNYQSVRYGRKPRWMPRAKTKMFKINPRIEIPIEETLELQRLHNNYRTYMRSIRAYLVSQWQEKTQETIDHAAVKQQYEEDFHKSLLLNQEWSEQLRPIRENFIENELKSKLELALETIQTKKAEETAKMEEIEELVRHVKADSHKFVTPENIDSVTDHILENPVDHNYALNLKGDKIIDFETKNS